MFKGRTLCKQSCSNWPQLDIRTKWAYTNIVKDKRRLQFCNPFYFVGNVRSCKPIQISRYNSIHVSEDLHGCLSGINKAECPVCLFSLMLKTLERYQKCSYGSLEVNNPGKDIEQSSYREYLKLKSKYESLQRYQRQLLGDDLGPLNINDLEHIEHQLDTSLKHIRSTRTQVMLDQLSDLQAKEKMMLDANKALERKLEEICTANHIQHSWVGGGEQNNTYSHQHAQSQGFFHPLDCNSTLQIGYNDPVSSSQMTAATDVQNVNGLIPGWML